MKPAFLARKSHKWIALLAGVQGAVWMLSGAYMVVVDLDFIHGDSLVRNLAEPLPENLGGLYPISSVLQRFPDSYAIQAVSQRNTPRYIVQRNSSPVLLDAQSGAVLSPIDSEEATLLAQHYYSGSAGVEQVKRLSDEETKPIELQTTGLPLWQVTFDDRINTTFYISPNSGELVVRRHAFWRIFDFLWMLHIMDYDDRSQVNNNLLRVAALVGTGMAVSGIWLLFFAFRSRPAPPGNRGAVST